MIGQEEWLQTVRGVYTAYKGEILHCMSGEALPQVALRSCGCPVPGTVHVQAVCGSQ